MVLDLLSALIQQTTLRGTSSFALRALNLIRNS